MNIWLLQSLANEDSQRLVTGGGFCGHTHHLKIPFALFQIDLSFDGFSVFLGSGFRMGFGEGDGDGETARFGDAAVVTLALLAARPASDKKLPRHQGAASTPEPRIAMKTIIAAAARRNRLSRGAEGARCSGTFMRANSGR